VSVGQSSGGQLGGFGGGSTSTGVIVRAVVDGKPAQQAGLVAGDVITEIGGTSLDSPGALSAFMLAHHPGDKVQLTWTDPAGASHTATVELATGPPA
jgi:S1-C subfamily serine protease